ncbi:MAG: hypothetical protein PUF72_07300, partial [Clostridiales bacterium]|nr:hypothetical protein [Clostridiales bacterium]
MDKKKLFGNLAVVLTAAALVMGTAACKKAEKKSALREASSSDEQSEILEKAKAQSRSGENEEKREEEGDTPSEENAPAEKSTEEAGAAVSDTYAPGINTDSGFESAFIGVRFNTPAGYVLSPQQTIDEQNKVNADSGEENMKYMKYEASVVNDEKTMQVIVASDGNKGDFSEEDYIS